MTAQLIHQDAQTHTQAQAQAQTQASSPASAASRRRIGFGQISRAVREMNAATRRLVELQAPWSVDARWYTK